MLWSVPSRGPSPAVASHQPWPLTSPGPSPSLDPLLKPVGCVGGVGAGVLGGAARYPDVLQGVRHRH